MVELYRSGEGDRSVRRLAMTRRKQRSPMPSVQHAWINVQGAMQGVKVSKKEAEEE